MSSCRATNAKRLATLDCIDFSAIVMPMRRGDTPFPKKPEAQKP